MTEIKYIITKEENEEVGRRVIIPPERICLYILVNRE